MKEEEILKMIKEKYDYKEGHLYRKKDNFKLLGILDSNANGLHFRIKLYINGKRHWIPYHHAIFIWHYGYRPKYLIHIDKNKANNCIENLKKIDNMSDLKMYSMEEKENKTGYTGVIKDGNGWYARLQKNKKTIWSKVCRSAKEAHYEYLRLKNEATS